MKTATLVMDLPSSMTLGDADELIDKLLENGSIERPTVSRLIVTWEEADGWALRGVVDLALLTIEEHLDSSSFRFEEAIARVQLGGEEA